MKKGRCRGAKYAYAIIDIVSRKWIATLLAAEATSTRVRVLFLDALAAEDLLDDDIIARVAALDDTSPSLDDDEIPLLLAIVGADPGLPHTVPGVNARCRVMTRSRQSR